MYIENIDREWALEGEPGRLDEAITLLESDPIRGIHGLEELVERKSVLAMLYIGDVYANGRGVIRDIIAGENWYERAAAEGSIEAAHRLAFIYYHRRNYEKSIATLSLIAGRGFIPAMYCLGSFYFTGTGVTADLEVCVRWWAQAEAGGHLLAKKRISIVQRSGYFGFARSIMGFIKLTALIAPYVVLNLRNPKSDRLRGW